MPSRWFNITVVLFWLCSMSWLALTKVLPPFYVGEPPNYRAILAEQRQMQPACWLVRWREEPLGWAISRVVRRPDEMMAIQGQIFLQQLPLEELAPGWLGSMLRPFLRRGALSTSAVTLMDVDSLGRLVGFESRLGLNDFNDALRIVGRVDGNHVQLAISQAGESIYKDDRHLPSSALLGDQLSPQSVLPGLKVGQSWTMPAFNLFRPPKNSIEILQVEVERREKILWNGVPTMTYLVVCRCDSGASLASHEEPRSRLWVREDGLVVKQEIIFFNSPLWFIRMPEEKGRFASTWVGNWAEAPSPERTTELLKELSRPEGEPNTDLDQNPEREPNNALESNPRREQNPERKRRRPRRDATR